MAWEVRAFLNQNVSSRKKWRAGGADLRPGVKRRAGIPAPAGGAVFLWGTVSTSTFFFLCAAGDHGFIETAIIGDLEFIFVPDLVLDLVGDKHLSHGGVVGEEELRLPAAVDVGCL